ncbi:MAG: hypothetical protein JWM41_2822 [Gemmatimonadetes bacterium]|nr:hypothetical protein [Gemmatimonadota bacterium]
MRISKNGTHRIDGSRLPLQFHARNDGIRNANGNRAECLQASAWHAAKVQRLARHLPRDAHDTVAAAEAVDRQPNEGAARRLAWLDSEPWLLRQLPQLRASDVRRRDDESAKCAERVTRETRVKKSHSGKIHRGAPTPATPRGPEGTNHQWM